ncbi:hypothetical protein I7I51_05436, partial [Histoplasma capsulatum]
GELLPYARPKSRSFSVSQHAVQAGGRASPLKTH